MYFYLNPFDVIAIKIKLPIMPGKNFPAPEPENSVGLPRYGFYSHWRHLKIE